MAAYILVGLVNGVFIAVLGLQPFVVTLGMMSIARSMGLVISNNRLIFEFGPEQKVLTDIGAGNLFGIPNEVYFLVVIALIMGFVFRWTKWSRHIFAIGGNEKAAILTGAPVKTIKVSVYVLAALLAGFAGWLQLGWLGSAATSMGLGMELTVIAAAVIGGANLMGGAGTAFGAVIGAPHRTHPQQPHPAGHQHVLAGNVRGNVHRPCRRLRQAAQQGYRRVGRLALGVALDLRQMGAAGEVGLQLGHKSAHGVAGVMRGAALVRGKDHVLHLEQGGGNGGFVLEHVERRAAEFAVAQQFHHGGLVDGVAASNVHQHAVGTEGQHDLAVDQLVGRSAARSDGDQRSMPKLFRPSSSRCARSSTSSPTANVFSASGPT